MDFTERTDRVLDVLLRFDGLPLTASEISGLAELVPGTIQPVLTWLEGERTVVAHWVDDGTRRYRVYRLASPEG